MVCADMAAECPIWSQAGLGFSLLCFAFYFIFYSLPNWIPHCNFT
jgi:hypothetical protein